MKNLLTLALLGILLLTACSGCAASKVKQEVLLPAASGAWVEVQLLVDRGTRAGLVSADLTLVEVDSIDANADRLTEGLDESNAAKLSSVDWPELETWAKRGVSERVLAGEIDVGVGDSYYELIKNMGDMLDKLTGRVADLSGGLRRIYPASGYVAGTYQSAPQSGRVYRFNTRTRVGQ